MATKYEEVYHWLCRWIDQNKFSNRQKIPSENMLCRRLSVSRETVRHAIELLTQERLLYTVRGSGTFINKDEVMYRDLRRKTAERKIALILQGQDKNANSALIRGVREALGQADIDLQIFFTDNRFVNERNCLESILTQRFNGLIVDGVKASLLNPNLDCYETLQSQGIPVIFYNNYYKELDFPHVLIDDAQAADALMSRLAQAGHRQIAGLFVYDNYQSIEKYKGYIKGLKKYGGVYHDDHVKWCISTEMQDPTFRRQIKLFLKSVPECTAIVCCNYMLLEHVQAVLTAEGKTVPEDYSLVCFDYSNTDWQTTGVTCSLHPGFELGRRVGSGLLRLMDGAPGRQSEERIQAEIFDGRSVAAPGSLSSPPTVSVDGEAPL